MEEPDEVDEYSYSELDRPQYPTPKVIDSKKIYERLKSKVQFWKHQDVDGSSFNTMDKRQQELWKLIRDSPLKFNQNNGAPESKEAHASPLQPIGESANTFLTDNDKDVNVGDQFIKVSPMKITALDQSPLFEVHSTTKELTGPSPPVLVERLTDKLHFKKVGLKRIQDRLGKIADSKENVARNYNKLASEITAWCSLCLERDSELDLLTDLQQVLAADKKSEQTMTRLFMMINAKLEYVAKREENMLQERKDMNALTKKYDALRVRKGDQSMETQYLKENLQRKRTSLQQLTEQYYESLSKILREEFTRACFTIYEMGSELKDVTRDFSLQSIELLKNGNDSDYIDGFLEDVRKLRADKQWNKLSMQEKNNPNKLAELVGNLYNGQDSLLRIASNKVPIKFSPLPLHENASTSTLDPQHFKASEGLDLSMSQYGTDKYNDITTNKFMLKKPLFTDVRPVSQQPLQTLQNLRAPVSSHGATGSAGGGATRQRNLASNIANNYPYQRGPSLVRSKAEPNGLRNEIISENVSAESIADADDKEVVIKFGHDLTNSFIEADQLLATNAWD
ncbi:Ssp1p [Kluyveromyces lactis]|uniref:KLLA0A09361p n=1 Tax=Kluyveromyces lactis (strain ATCC 8585 / CBS 2359 / DSM 70799 / NBRC 1267 / NRRL Y-1140 / WM37) TaxID=284590 RepID=Q6CXD0_KLULA|nr:uncharacterized protein KLLA0_A09361g [Kluyveromyces lactis]CAH02997.1 KLLA0A09361p [Kluyveromyces lactis]|eukprot:XP_451409.1 uncharacterized protein KLLA0_A09361g [Kluyveromyces lactis]